MLRALLAALLLMALAPGLAASSACPAEGAQTGIPYLTQDGPAHTGVRVAGADVHEEIFWWQGAAVADVWIETNGLEGLQRAAGPCGPADQHALGASVGTGRPTIPL